MKDPLEANLRSLATFLADISWERLPPEAHRNAVRIFVDDLGGGIVGGEEPELIALRAQWAGGRGSDEATLLGPGFERIDALRACLHNGTGMSKSELCGGYRHRTSHAGMYTLPTALALGEQRRASGQRMLAAMVAGYEAAARCATAFRARLGFLHPHGPWGMVGASVTAAHLRGADAEGMYRALTLSLALLPATAWNIAMSGGTIRTAWSGINAMVATFIPDFVRAGFETGMAGITQQLRDLLQVEWDPDKLVNPLHPDYAVIQNYHKRFAAAGFVFPALEALEEIFPELPVDPARIEHVDVFVPGEAERLKAKDPDGDVAARFSIPYCVAQFLMSGRLDPANFTAAALADPVVRDLRHRVDVILDPSLPHPYSMQRSSRVTVRLSDGGERSAFCENCRGDFTNPLPDEELDEKFLRVTRPILGARGEEVLRLARQIASAPDVRTFMDAIAGRNP